MIVAHKNSEDAVPLKKEAHSRAGSKMLKSVCNNHMFARLKIIVFYT
jgi:hypothetical protein